MSKTRVYQITGREREQLQALQMQVAGLTGQFVTLVNFIARREGLHLEALLFNADELTFIPKPKANGKNGK